MSVSVVRDEKLSKEYRLKIDAKEIEAQINALIEKEKDGIAIQGFRKGKAPIALIKKQYHNHFHDRAMNTLWSESIEKIANDYNLNKNELQFKPNESQEGGVDINLTYDTVDAFDLVEGSSIKIDDYSFDIESEAFKAEALEARHAFSQVDYDVEFDGALEKGQYAEVKVSVYNDDENTMEIFTNKVISIFTNNDKYVGADFMKALLGMKKGDKKTIEIQFPKEQGAKVLSEKKHKVSLELMRVHLLKVTTLEEFIASVKKEGEEDDAAKNRIVGSYAATFRDHLTLLHKRQILDKLDAAYHFEVSPKLLEEAVEDLQKRFKEEEAMAKEHHVILEEHRTKTAKEIEAEINKLALRRIKMNYIFKKLEESFPKELRLTETDIQMQAIQFAQSRGVDFGQVFEALGKDKEFARSLGLAAREDKIINFIHKNATLNKVAFKNYGELLAVYNEVMPGTLRSF